MSINSKRARAILRGLEDLPPVGKTKELLLNEDVHFVAWLLSNTPDHGSLAKTLIGIAKNVYDIEMKARNHASSHSHQSKA